ncbi:PilC/PilY family type IV pilus protein [Noviherbaspirillum sedimenti]|nr:PilC/PilY family type IV pilus protein [Noviherbaspirillum sedimenti]
MKPTRLIAASMLASLLSYPLAGMSEDIDLYSAINAAGMPNVLLVMDTGANFSNSAAAPCTAYGSGGAPSLGATAGGVEQCALVDAIESLPDSTVNIGIMVYNANGFTSGAAPGVGPCIGDAGGCLVKPLTLMNSANKAAFIQFIKSWKSSGSNSSTEFNVKTNNQKTGSAMQEAWAYYHGKTGMSGKNYGASLLTTGCQRNFIIFIGNSFNNAASPGDPNPGPENSSDGLYSAQVAASAAQKIKLSNTIKFNTMTCGVDSLAATSNSNNWSENWADEWARYMNETDFSTGLSGYTGSQNIITYTIGVINNGTNSCKPDYPALLSNMASYGGGKYFQTGNASEVKNALLSVLNEVQAVNSVFASASLPISVNTQGTFLNQVYMGMFRPDGAGSPRWSGNLKQYQFKYDDNSGRLILADNRSPAQSALSSAGTGFIDPNAASFWTKKDLAVEPDLGGGFWRNAPSGEGSGKSYDSPDGEVVEKGGIAQRLRLANLNNNYSATAGSANNPRKLYTYCPSGASCEAALTHASNVFAPTNAVITAAKFGGVAGISVSSLTRAGTTATVVTVANHGFVTGDQISIGGANQIPYNGTFTITKVNDTTFTYTVPEYPPASPTGTFTASVPGVSSKSITSLTRGAGTPNAVVTATAPAHGYTVGQNVTITGASYAQYNVSATVTAVLGTDQFQYVITETPAFPGTSPGANAQAWVGDRCVTNGNAKNCVSIESIYRSGNTVMVTASINGNGSLPAVFSAGAATLAKISGVTMNEYNSSTGYAITGIGASCSITTQTWNAASSSMVQTIIAGTPNKSFCFTSFPSSLISPPVVTDAATVSTSVDTGIPYPVTLARNGTTVTATSSTAHPFTAGQTVSISGNAGPNEEAYVGSFAVSYISNTKFSYQVVVTPALTATGTITAAKAGSIDAATLINWVRGEDNVGDEKGPGTAVSNVRPSIHGDVLHSRPLVINYGGVSPKVVVFYGANDGVFRAINGNQTTAIGSVLAGGEMWGLILPEHYSKLNRLRINSPELKFPTTSDAITPTPQRKDYFVDGPTGVYQKLNADGTTNKAIIYLSMRRGGRFIYAMDVTDPADPKVLWNKGCRGTPVACDTNYEELGQTWSRPRIALLKGYTDNAGAAKPVLIFAAGYDTAQDSEPHYAAPGVDSMGRGIFVVDAMTGAVIWSAKAAATGASTTSCTGTSPTVCAVVGMKYSMPSDITILDRDMDGRVDRVYAADVGGNVWRVDFELAAGNAPANWKVSQLAALGCDSGACASGTTPRKFLYPPSVVTVGAAGVSGSFDAVMLGSGDREHPLYSTVLTSSYKVPNRFYMLKDLATGKDAGSQTTITHDSNSDGLFDATTNLYSLSSADRGYYLDFAEGEKLVNAPLTVGGTAYFGTNQPSPPGVYSCDAGLGIARSYGLDPFTAKYYANELHGGGFPPSPTAGVTMDASGKKREYCMGCSQPPSDPNDPNAKPPCVPSALETCDAGKEGKKQLKRTYWYKQ